MLKRKIILLCGTLLFTYVVPAQTKTTKLITDTAVNGIKLEDHTSTETLLGANIWNKHFEADSMFPRIECINRNNDEGLRLFFHYGGTKNAVAEFELFSIGAGYKRPQQAVKTGFNKFRSGLNIMLGLSKKRIIGILGKNFKTSSTKGEEMIEYYTDDPNSNVLKKYKGVAYFIKCRFRNNKLIQYNFGFEYP